MATLQQAAFDRAKLNLALETSIYIGLAIMLVAACLLIVLPFVPLITWGIIIAVAVYPTFRKLQSFLRKGEVLPAILCTVVLLAVMIVPAVLLAQSLVQGIHAVSGHLKEGSAIIPPPPPSIDRWPILGAPLKRLWGLASQDMTEALRSIAPRIKSVLPGLLSASAGLAVTLLQLLLSILLAGALLANAQGCHRLTSSLMNRIFGERGPEFQQLIGATIRSVTFGILGVAIIQSVFAALGFLVVGLPAVGLWTVIFLFAAVVQAGILVLAPAVIYVFATTTATKAVLFLIWSLLVGLMANVLKPLLLGRGVAVPVLVIFLGAIGGFLAMGVIGLFVGAIVLSVGYKLFLAWLRDGPVAISET